MKKEQTEPESGRGALLEIQGLEVQYVVGKQVMKAVNHIYLTMNQGETLGLVGETGAGKTTTALGIMGLIPNPPGKVVNGKIVYKGEDLLLKTEKQMRRIRGGEITMIFQDPMTSLNPLISVGEQIAEVIQLHSKTSKLKATEKAREMLELVGIGGNRYSDFPHQFSGGMKQRVMIAIALACDPHLLIADEPTTALDVTIQAQVLHLMNNLKREFNTSMLLITHDLGVVAEVCDKVAIMYAGEIVESGTLEDIFHNMQHPYTEGLFHAIPSLDRDEERLETIKGLVPDPANLPTGCKFHPRCPKCKDHCKTCIPPDTEISPGHMVKCHLYAAE